MPHSRNRWRCRIPAISGNRGRTKPFVGREKLERVDLSRCVMVGRQVKGIQSAEILVGRDMTGELAHRRGQLPDLATGPQRVHGSFGSDQIGFARPAEITRAEKRPRRLDERQPGRDQHPRATDGGLDFRARSRFEGDAKDRRRVEIEPERPFRHRRARRGFRRESVSPFRPGAPPPPVSSAIRPWERPPA